MLNNFYSDYEKLLEIEKKYDLYSYKVNDEYIWPYLRNKVYGLIHNKNIFTSTTNINKFSYNSFDKNELFSYVNEARDCIIFNFTRKELNSEGIVFDERTKRLKDALDKNNVSFYEVDFKQEGLFQNNYNEVFNCEDINDYYENYTPNKLIDCDTDFIEKISTEISDSLSISFNIKMYLQEITKKIDVYHSFFYEMFLKLKPKYIFVTANYMMNEIIIPAKELNIPVYEIQYAAITDFHNGYHYNGANVPTYPDGILTWGNYWSQYDKFPSNLKTITEVGSDKKFNLSKKSKKKVSIISQNLMSNEIVSKAIDLAINNEDYDFNVRLHPNEELSTELASKIDNILNINLDRSSLEYTLSSSEYVIGVSSTVLYEAVHYGCKILIIDAYMSEFVNDLISKQYAHWLVDLDLNMYSDLEFNTNKEFYNNDEIDLNSLPKSDIKQNSKYQIIDKLHERNQELVSSKKLIDVSNYKRYLEDKKKLLTIVIPNYNGGSKLKRTLNSVSFSEYKELYKVYLVDDCSNDNSLLDLDKYKSEIDFEILTTGKNSGGPGKPRQIGLEHTKTKYIYFLDNDDVVNFKILLKALYIMESKDLDYIRMSNLVKFSEKIFRFETDGCNYETFLFNAPFIWNGIYKVGIINDKKIKMRCGIAEDFNFNAKYLYNCENMFNFKEDVLIYYKEDSTVSLDMSYNSLIKLLDNHIDTSEYLTKNASKKIVEKFYNQTINEYLIYNSSFECLISSFDTNKQVKINEKLELIFQLLQKKIKVNEKFYTNINQKYTYVRVYNVKPIENELYLNVEKLRNVELKHDLIYKINNKESSDKTIVLKRRLRPYFMTAKYKNKYIKFKQKKVYYNTLMIDEETSSVSIINFSIFLYIRYKKENIRLIIKCKNYFYNNLMEKLKKILKRIKK